MKIGLKVSYNDGQSKDVEAVFADFVAFERTWNRSITQFETELRLTDLAWLAWNSEKRRKQTALPFEPDWIESVQGIEPQPDDDTGVDSPLPQVQHTD